MRLPSASVAQWGNGIFNPRNVKDDCLLGLCERLGAENQSILSKHANYKGRRSVVDFRLKVWAVTCKVICLGSLCANAHNAGASCFIPAGKAAAFQVKIQHGLAFVASHYHVVYAIPQTARVLRARLSSQREGRAVVNWGWAFVNQLPFKFDPCYHACGFIEQRLSQGERRGASLPACFEVYVRIRSTLARCQVLIKLINYVSSLFLQLRDLLSDAGFGAGERCACGGGGNKCQYKEFQNTHSKVESINRTLTKAREICKLSLQRGKCPAVRISLLLISRRSKTALLKVRFCLFQPYGWNLWPGV